MGLLDIDCQLGFEHTGSAIHSRDQHNLQIAAKTGAPFPDWYDAGKEAIKTSPAPLGTHPCATVVLFMGACAIAGMCK